MDLNEKDIKALLNYKTWDKITNNTRHHFMVKTKILDERFDKSKICLILFSKNVQRSMQTVKLDIS